MTALGTFYVLIMDERSMQKNALLFTGTCTAAVTQYVSWQSLETWTIQTTWFECFKFQVAWLEFEDEIISLLLNEFFTSLKVAFLSKPAYEVDWNFQNGQTTIDLFNNKNYRYCLNCLIQIQVVEVEFMNLGLCRDNQTYRIIKWIVRE